MRKMWFPIEDVGEADVPKPVCGEAAGAAVTFSCRRDTWRRSGCTWVLGFRGAGGKAPWLLRARP